MVSIDTVGLRRLAADLADIRELLLPSGVDAAPADPAGVPELDAACAELAELAGAVRLAQARRIDAMSSTAALAAARWEAAENALAGAF